jgi:zinc transport system substrate-binding protein
MVPPGASPHTYEPSPSQLVALAGADMYAIVGSGIDFELAWMDKLIAQNEDMLLIDCSEGIELMQSGGGEHEGMDPHIWMSPANARTMVINITDGLIRADPSGKTYYEQNRDAYLDSLQGLDGEIRRKLASIENRTMLVLHPAFGYFAREYDLDMISIETEGKEPTPAELTRTIREADISNVRAVFASPQFNPQSARVVADAIGARVVLIDPLAADYIANMHTLANELAAALE